MYSCAEMRMETYSATGMKQMKYPRGRARLAFAGRAFSVDVGPANTVNLRGRWESRTENLGHEISRVKFDYPRINSAPVKSKPVRVCGSVLDSHYCHSTLGSVCPRIRTVLSLRCPLKHCVHFALGRSIWLAGNSIRKILAGNLARW